MPSPFNQQRIWRHLAIAVCVLLIGGCAGIPRIDPTGEQLFVWPDEQAQSAVPVLGNTQATPVYTDSVFPSPGLPPTIGATPIGIPAVPQDTMLVTPQRVLAPVGSEVILKAGLCTSEQFMLTKTRIDWLIARESAGEFVSLGGRGWMENPILPWNKPKKIDNQYATGYAATVPQTLDRGTPDTRDDVQVEPGESWVSITSPVEGTSHITAMTPEIEAWAKRKATATIYWIDVQWSFPPTSVSANNSQVLTTTVRRQTDGTPLEGWILRYDVAGGAGSFSGSQASQTVEVRTDVNGKASIDVTPTGEGGNTTQINAKLVRPQNYRNSNTPELIVGNGTTTITWGGSDYLPPLDDLSGSPLNESPPQTTFPTDSQPLSTIPQQQAPPVDNRKPALQLEVYGDTQAQVDGVANVEVVIKNVGDAVATGMLMVVKFDDGLMHPGDSDREYRIYKDENKLDPISPGISITEKITFNVVKPGPQTLLVTVSCRDGGPPINKQLFVDVLQPQPTTPDVLPETTPPSADVLPPGTTGGETLAIELIPRANQVRVDTRAYYQIVVQNRAPTPDHDVKVVVTFPEELKPDPSAITSSAGVTAHMEGNKLHFLPVAELPSGAKLEFLIPADIIQTGTRNIVAEVSSRSVTTSVKDVKQIDIIIGDR